MLRHLPDGATQIMPATHALVVGTLELQNRGIFRTPNDSHHAIVYEVFGIPKNQLENQALDVGVRIADLRLALALVIFQLLPFPRQPVQAMPRFSCSSYSCPHSEQPRFPLYNLYKGDISKDSTYYRVRASISASADN